MTNFIFLSISIAGAAVLWRKILKDFPRLELLIKTVFPGNASKPLICGLCFTYWIAFFVIFLYPGVRVIDLRGVQGYSVLSVIIEHSFNWLALAGIANLIRFILLVLSEHLIYQTHHLNKNTVHNHS